MKAREPFKEFMDAQKPARIVTPPREVKDDWEYLPVLFAWRNMTTGEMTDIDPND